MKATLAIFVLCFFSTAVAAESPKTLGNVLSEYGISIPALDGVVVEKDFPRKGEKTSFRNVSARGKDIFADIEIVMPVDAAFYEKQSSRFLRTNEDLYGAQRTPYPGEITNIGVCGKDKKPLRRSIEVLNRKIEVLAGHATDRFSFGACQPDVAKMAGAIGFIYIRDRQASLRLRVFRPIAKFKRESLFAIYESVRQSGEKK